MILLVVLTALTLSSNTQTIDSSDMSTNSAYSLSNTQMDEDDVESGYDPGLALFALFGIGFIFICLGTGVVLTIISLLIIFGLIGAGILSASVLVALYQKSIAKGFKLLLVSTTTVCGLFIGTIGFYLFNKIVHWFTTQTALIIGTISGLLTGALLGFLMFFVFKNLTALLKSKLHLN
jgi:hypothetical protein